MTTTHTDLNVDPTEVGKFSDLAHLWWETDGKFRPLHDINPLRLQWIDSLAKLKDKKVLDVGCGGGILSDSMAHLGAHVVGIDMSEKVLQVAQLHALEAQTPTIEYRQIAVENLALQEPAQYDVVTCMEMLEHVPNPQSVISAIAQLVRPGGWVFLSTINKNPKAFAMAIVGAEYVMNLLPKGTHEYARFIRPSELTRMARQAGLELSIQSGLHYNPWTHKAKLVQDVSINYMQAYQRN